MRMLFRLPCRASDDDRDGAVSGAAILPLIRCRRWAENDTTEASARSRTFALISTLTYRLAYP